MSDMSDMDACFTAAVTAAARPARLCIAVSASLGHISSPGDMRLSIGLFSAELILLTEETAACG